MSSFEHYDVGQLLQMICEEHLKFEYSRAGDVQYMRNFAAQTFFPATSDGLSAAQLKSEHNKDKIAAKVLSQRASLLYNILKDWCNENEQNECHIMVFGDTEAGKL